MLGRYCSTTTILMVGSFTPVASVLASTTRNLDVCGAASNRLATSDMPLEGPPSARTSRFGSPLVLCRVHWARPELVIEVKYLTCTEDNLLRQVVYEGLREGEPAGEVRRPISHPEPAR